MGLGFNGSTLDFLIASTRHDPIVRHPIVDRQRGHKQLGQIATIDDNADHTRLHHLGLVVAYTQMSLDGLQMNGGFPTREIDVLANAKLHDVGHGPKSHASEYLLRSFVPEGHMYMDHKLRGVRLLDSDERDPLSGKTLRELLEQSGVDMKVLRQMMLGEHPAAKIVSHKGLGTDCAAYLALDSARCHMPLQPPDWISIAPHLTFMDNGLALDVSGTDDSGHIIDLAAQHIRHKVYMYTHCYLTWKSLAHERHIQLALEHAIYAGIFSPDQVWDFADDVVEHYVLYSNKTDEHTAIAKEHMIRHTANKPYQPCVALKLPQYQMEHMDNERVYAIDSDFKHQFIDKFSDPRELTKLEADLSRELGAPVMVSLLPDHEKVNPVDVKIYRKGSEEGSLKGNREGAYTDMENQAAAHFSIRLLVHPDEQPNVLRKADRAAALLKDIAQDYFKRA